MSEVIDLAQKRAERSHIWNKEVDGHYVEPTWCSARLFDVEEFVGKIDDPCCGFGTIPEAAERAGLLCTGSDIVPRGYECMEFQENFMLSDRMRDNIVCNPPFHIFGEFARHALALARRKVCMIALVRRLPAARWLQSTPLARVWLLTPRPSMPPGHVIASGEKPGGGKQDFCWLVWDKAHRGPAAIGWLHRDAVYGDAYQRVAA